MEIDKNIDMLTNAATTIRGCRFDAQSSFRYDLMSDSVIWEDEMPNPFMGDSLALRLLFRYRTSVLLGNPDVQLEGYWLHGKSLFPDWPGFTSDRSTPSQEILDFLKKVRAKKVKC
jgi:hypothetical protein